MSEGRSRYAQATPLFVGKDGSIFRGVGPRQIGPAEGVIQHTVVAGERLDLLAQHYYNDDRLWWRIVDANPEVLFGQELVQEETLVERDQPQGQQVAAQRPGTEALEDDKASVLLEGRIGRVILIPKATE